MVTWAGRPSPVPKRPTATGWLRVLIRGTAILAMLLVAFPLLLALRLPEALLYGPRRPWTPFITQSVCIATCAILSLRRTLVGMPARGEVASVANHVSWLDIFVLNAGARVTFVAKAEVRGWLGIGWLARGTGTLFVERRRDAAAAQRDELQKRLLARQNLLIFPEGTSTDGLRVLPFKSTLFEAFFTDDLAEHLVIQPVSLAYFAPVGTERDFYGWWGAAAFGPSLLQVLAQAPQGEVRVTYHTPLPVRDFKDRKALACAAEIAVRSGLSPSP